MMDRVSRPRVVSVCAREHPRSDVGEIEWLHVEKGSRDDNDDHIVDLNGGILCSWLANPVWRLWRLNGRAFWNTVTFIGGRGSINIDQLCGADGFIGFVSDGHFVVEAISDHAQVWLTIHFASPVNRRSVDGLLKTEPDTWRMCRKPLGVKHG